MYVRTCVVCGEHVTGMVPDDDDFSNATDTGVALIVRNLSLISVY